MIPTTVSASGDGGNYHPLPDAEFLLDLDLTQLWPETDDTAKATFVEAGKLVRVQLALFS